MKIRITAAVLPYGAVQLLRGQVLDISEDLALKFVEQGEASLVPFAEQATRPRPETAIIPRIFAKPKPQPPAKKARR